MPVAQGDQAEGGRFGEKLAEAQADLDLSAGRERFPEFELEWFRKCSVEGDGPAFDGGRERILRGGVPGETQAGEWA